jgi:hypothetical protein
MAGKTRKLRKGGGWFSKNSRMLSNVRRNASNALSEIKQSNAKASVKDKAKTAATRRWDYQRLEKKKDDLIIERRHAEEDIKDIDKKQELIVQEELKKEAEKWVKLSQKPRGWFGR